MYIDIDDDVPVWIGAEARRAGEMFGIHPAWVISISVATSPFGNDGWDAATDTDPEYMQARMEFKPNMPEDSANVSLVWHEVGHILLSHLMKTAFDGLSHIKGDQAKSLAIRNMDYQEELTIQKLVYGCVGRGIH